MVFFYCSLNFAESMNFDKIILSATKDIAMLQGILHHSHPSLTYDILALQKKKRTTY
jgi:hypothetical protein